MSEELKCTLMARACSPDLADDICAKLAELAALKAQRQAAPAVPDRLDDEAVERIYDDARRSFRRHMGSVRGQMFVPADSEDYHIIFATLAELRAAQQQKAGGAE